MKRKLTLLILTLGILIPLRAELLWKAVAPDGGRTIYLFGTHHLAPVEMLDTLAGFGEAFGQSVAVIGEMDMADAATPAAAMTLSRAGMAPADSTLSKVLSPVQLDSVASLVSLYAGQPVPPSAFEPMKPAMLSTMIAMMQSSAAFPDYDPSKQLDSYVQTLARKADKEVLGLETVEQQAAVLFGASIAEQARDLMREVAGADRAIETARELAALYVKGDLDGLLKLMEDPSTGFDAAQSERLITSRNEAWVKILAGLLPTATVLVVVGAGHLVGPKGLLALLRGEGYDVTPM